MQAEGSRKSFSLNDQGQQPGTPGTCLVQFTLPPQDCATWSNKGLILITR